MMIYLINTKTSLQAK